MTRIDVLRLNEEGYEYLKEVFMLPDYFGNNLDALYDSLTDRNSLTVVYDNYLDATEFSKRVIRVINLAVHNLYMEDE